MSMSGRGNTISDALVLIFKILENRDQLQLDRELLKNVDPASVESQKDKIPRWYLELILTLTAVYDKGFAEGADRNGSKKSN
jgi:hypothetical protein